MVYKNYIEFLIEYSLTSKLYIKILLLLLFCYIFLVFLSGLYNFIKFLNEKNTTKKNLLNQESRLINLRKKYLDGKINASEYKINTMQILNKKI